MSDVTIVRFLRPMDPYNAGEVAGFPPAKADDLVNQGVAAYEDQHGGAHVERAVGIPQRELSARAGDRLRSLPTNMPTAGTVSLSPTVPVDGRVVAENAVKHVPPAETVDTDTNPGKKKPGK